MQANNNVKHFRAIKSFVRREGRTSPKKIQIWNSFWPRYGIEVSDFIKAKSDVATFLNKSSKRVLEIGFGDGTSLLEQASKNPLNHFLGVEVYKTGIISLLDKLANNNMHNVKICCIDSITLLKDVIADNSLDMVQIFFPDPWPKKSHHKRRLIQPEFLKILEQKLADGGRLHLATDWQEYADHMFYVLSQNSNFVRDNSQEAEFIINSRPQTKFEKRGLKLGHKVSDFLYTLK